MAMSLAAGRFPGDAGVFMTGPHLDGKRTLCKYDPYSTGSKRYKR